MVELVLNCLHRREIQRNFYTLDGPRPEKVRWTHSWVDPRPIERWDWRSHQVHPKIRPSGFWQHRSGQHTRQRKTCGAIVWVLSLNALCVRVLCPGGVCPALACAACLTVLFVLPHKLAGYRRRWPAARWICNLPNFGEFPTTYMVFIFTLLIFLSQKYSILISSHT